MGQLLQGDAPYKEWLKNLGQRWQQSQIKAAIKVNSEPSHSNRQQLVDDLNEKIVFYVPWGHHILLVDRFREEPEKALFYVRKTLPARGKDGGMNDISVGADPCACPASVHSNQGQPQGGAPTNNHADVGADNDSPLPHIKERAAA